MIDHEPEAQPGGQTNADADAQPAAETGAEADAEAGAGEQRTWQPSGAPAHRAATPHPQRGTIVELQRRESPRQSLMRFLRQPMVKAILWLTLFVVAAITYDATVNFGSWTERAEKPKATEHRGMPSAPPAP